MNVPMTSVKYTDNGGVICPNCESTNLSGTEVDIDGGIATRTVMCLDCDANWTDLYELKGYRYLDIPDTEERSGFFGVKDIPDDPFNPTGVKGLL